jgi:RNA polymerase sigma-70 factor (ECF subfamily)
VSQTSSHFEKLIENLEHQQEEAVQEIVERYADHILRVVRRHLNQKLRVRFDSEDFLQAVWATLFVKPSAFRHIETESQLVAFLAQIAFHKVIDARRANTQTQRRDVQREISLDQSDSSVNLAPANLATPSAYLIADEELQKIQAEIPQKLQWMLECRLRGMTFEAIAEQAGVHERTVRRVFDRLRQRIEEQ